MSTTVRQRAENDAGPDTGDEAYRFTRDMDWFNAAYWYVRKWYYGLFWWNLAAPRNLQDMVRLNNFSKRKKTNRWKTHQFENAKTHESHAVCCQLLAEIIEDSISKSGQGLVVEPASIPELHHSYTATDIIDRLGCSSGTINKYAKLSGLRTPAVGQRNHAYSIQDTMLILSQIMTSGVHRDVKQAAKAFHSELQDRKKITIEIPNRSQIKSKSQIEHFALNLQT
jgi:hypothetical protein